MTETVFDIARRNLGRGNMESSARLCLSDAVSLMDSGNVSDAEKRALRSVFYSVGMCDPDYAKAWRKVKGSAPVSSSI